MVSNISIFVMYTMYFLAALFGYLTFKGESSSPRNSEFVLCWLFVKHLYLPFIFKESHSPLNSLNRRPLQWEVCQRAIEVKYISIELKKTKKNKELTIDDDLI